MTRFKADFYHQPTHCLAKALLGQKLCTLQRGCLCSGRIVEVEAYCSKDDPACHSSRGKTARTEVMFRSPGHCYVYLIYGMHYCVNVVSAAEGVGEAVLIRAIEPIDGTSLMATRRKLPAHSPQLTNGPGKLCQALSITKRHNAEYLIDSPHIWIEAMHTAPEQKILCAPRVGISKATELEWRYYLADSSYVSCHHLRR